MWVIPTVRGENWSCGALGCRELERLLLLRNGLTYQEIAAELGLSAGTVHRHLRHDCNKLGARGKADPLRGFAGG